jgi:NADH:ubiquinone oxidoreductase subunit 6 (subunit J)
VLVVIGVQAGGGELTTEADISAAFGGPADIGELFLTDHVLAFEITSIVLLVAAVGGVILGAHARQLNRDHD